jgi:hypothetical protein
MQISADYQTLFAGRAVRHCRAAATFPTDPYPPVEFVKVNGAGDHEQARGYEFLASPASTGEPATGDHSSALGADVVTALCHLAEVINQRLQFRPFGGEQGLAVEFGGEDLVFGRHKAQCCRRGASKRRQLDGHRF